MTFTLTGFNTVKREGVELTGSFTAAINAEMKVGAVEETITVTGETPVVDLQSATKQRVIDNAVLGGIPTGRVFANYAILIPGISQTNASDVGGSLGSNMTDLIAHGSHADAQRILQNGVTVGTGTGGRSGSVPNIGAAQEVAVDFAAVDASLATGGVRVNFIPRDGGNTSKGNGFFGFANSSMQASNFTQRVQTLGLLTPNSVSRVWDVNPGFGGPIKKDKLWYYATVRNQGAWDYVGGLFWNANENVPSAWTYVPDKTRPAISQQIWEDAQLRLTWQATPKNKIGLTYDQQDVNGNPVVSHISADLL